MKPEQLFNEMTQFIYESRSLMESGAAIELAGLDGRVRSLCDAVLQLSQDQRLHYAARLQQLLGDLHSLGEDMMAQRDAMAEEIRQMPHHKKAHAAYRIIEASDKEDE